MSRPGQPCPPGERFSFDSHSHVLSCPISSSSVAIRTSPSRLTLLSLGESSDLGQQCQHNPVSYRLVLPDSAQHQPALSSFIFLTSLPLILSRLSPNLPHPRLPPLSFSPVQSCLAWACTTPPSIYLASSKFDTFCLVLTHPIPYLSEEWNLVLSP